MKIRAGNDLATNLTDIFEEEKKKLLVKHKDLIAQNLPQFEKIRANLYKHRAKTYPAIPHKLIKKLNYLMIYDNSNFIHNLYIYNK